MNIGQKVRELRIAKNLTQEELADRSELSKGFISQLERDLTTFLAFINKQFTASLQSLKIMIQKNQTLSSNILPQSYFPH